MEKNRQYIDPEDSDAKAYWLPDLTCSEDFLLPGGYFDELEKIIRNQCALTNTSRSEDINVPTAYFSDLESQILAQIRLDKFKQNSAEEFDVPTGFFNPEIPHSQTPRPRIRHLTKYGAWYAIAAAAVITAFIMILSSPDSSSSFSELLNTSDLTSDDLEFFVDADDLIEHFAEEINEPVFDTIEPATTEQPVPPIVDSTAVKPGPEPNPIPTTKPQKPETNTKPISFDDLTDEDIMEYLMDQGAEDLFEDL